MVIAAPREDFGKRELNDDELGSEPYALLIRWWQEAINAQLMMPDAAVLSTVDSNNHPNARVIFIKDIDENGLVFFTNYQSQKGQELAHNPSASLVLFWADFERQVRIRGIVIKTNRADSEKYFNARPRGSQLGAWASKQSEELASREELDAHFLEAQTRFKDKEVPCPPHWGGYRLHPDYFEFWQGRSNRLHDRFAFTLTAQQWKKKRLSP